MPAPTLAPERMPTAEPRDAALSEAERTRLECLALVRRLDARGLEEAVATLRYMAEDYSEPAPPAPPPAPPAEPIRARIVGGYTSIVPPLSEE